MMGLQLDFVNFLSPLAAKDYMKSAEALQQDCDVTEWRLGHRNTCRATRWSLFAPASGAQSMLNAMMEAVETPFSLVILSSAVPSLKELQSLRRVVQSRQILGAFGPSIGHSLCLQQSCWLTHYHLDFASDYEYSVIFDEASASSIRGSWFHEEKVEDKEGPCKLCETLGPTFLAHSDALRTVAFHPELDGEWALLDFSIRATRTPLLQVESVSSSSRPGWRHQGGHFAACPHAVLEEEMSLTGPHLYGRNDVPKGVAPNFQWFGDEASALGDVAKATASRLKPEKVARVFMESNHLKDFTGPEGQKRHFGCSLSKVNCPVPDWVYRGWAVPPCCKETMRHLLFYIDAVFKELGVRYIVTDGVLLGSYKFGGMLDWDADVDLHIHNDDFHLLEDVVQHRVKQDGHFLRKHANNRSWLLQANEQNYLLIELNLREEHWDPERVWQVPVQGHLFPAMEDAHMNLSAWYGMSFFKHRLRHVPEWEEAICKMSMLATEDCAWKRHINRRWTMVDPEAGRIEPTKSPLRPYHYNCVDEPNVASGKDCRVSLLVPTRPEKDPIARVQDAVEQWCLDEGLDGLRGGHLRTAFPPRSYTDREQSMSVAWLVTGTHFPDGGRSACSQRNPFRGNLREELGCSCTYPPMSKEKLHKGDEEFWLNLDPYTANKLLAKKPDGEREFGDAFHRFEVAKGHFSDSLEKMREKYTDLAIARRDLESSQLGAAWEHFSKCRPLSKKYGLYLPCHENFKAAMRLYRGLLQKPSCPVGASLPLRPAASPLLALAPGVAEESVGKQRGAAFL
ncbi:unnamed protein product [Cladocopium goreaui]|uniref:Ribitol 5-phosphate transferase FKRP (Fukutin-related protein) (Ribitol-5-phosphat e transferase) n=1 Tax=Cladocopium goreaui TaxID=2562237 RepID=A0A9P1DEI3_9DINO|nr:unnamed protein product [Cladocopium goreaui]